MRRFAAPPGAHFILVGLPGAGKSTVGAALSHRLRWGFLDFDIEIERRAGKTIPEIFASDGEAAFREHEISLTRELAGVRPLVLAPGGGWIAVYGAVGLLRPPSSLVYLRVSPDFAADRVRRSPRERPLFDGVAVEAGMQRLFAQRSPLFATADLIVDAEGLDVKGVTDRIVELADSRPSPIG